MNADNPERSDDHRLLQPRTAPRFATARNMALLAGVVVGVGVAVIAMLTALDERAQIAPALGGAAVALLAGIIALVPLHWANRRSPAAVPMLAMAGAGLRMVATLLGAVVLIVLVDLPMPAAALWTLGWYLLVMVFEIALILRYFRTL